MTEFYDKYQEAQHRTREDIEAEMQEIGMKIEHEEMTEEEWRHYAERLSELYDILRLKDIEARNREYLTVIRVGIE